MSDLYATPGRGHYSDSDYGPPAGSVSHVQSQRASQMLSPATSDSPHPNPSPLLRHAGACALGFDGAWPPLDDLFDLPIQSDQLVNDAKYADIRRQFASLCVHPPPLIFKAFNSDSFPPLDVFNHLIKLYFRRINRVITVFHFPTLALHSSHWILPLSIAAEGCQYLPGGFAASYAPSMREFLRRALLVLTESTPQEASPLELAQANVLHLISMAYSGDDKSMARARALHGHLVSFCLTEWRTSISEVRISGDPDFAATTSAWQEWILVETTRRVGYLIWMLDCMLACHFDQKPLLKLKDAAIPLPYPEVLWETSSAVRWHDLMIYSEPSPSLSLAVQTLYVEKSLKKTLAEFSHILIVYGLYHRMWEVEADLKLGPSPWTALLRDETKSGLAASPERLPAALDRDAWREATYQSLDLLRLAAMRVIGAASGVEHPTVCHLHLASVMLFAPVREIQEYARALVHGNATEARFTVLRDSLQAWVTEDQRRARVAVVYAGVQFWHIRKFSASAFYEPHAVLVSTLVLWAYGTFKVTESLDWMISEPSFGEDGTPMPVAMNVDRPADNELVQLFIKNGGRMLALMSGVGDVCGAQGPRRILTEGSKLLNTLDRWGCGKKATQLPELLLQV